MELVTAANNKEIFITAIESLADSIYLPLNDLVSIHWGRNFFDLAQLPELTKLAHQAGKRVYPVINGHPFQEELSAYQEAALKVYTAGADGVVVGSPELIYWIKETLAPRPPFIIIASSSAKIICQTDIDFLASLGADRVIISRLQALSEVRELVRQSALHLELFVHGLICPCWEGYDCLIPLATYGPDTDRGSCVSLHKDGGGVACINYQAQADSIPLWQMRVQCDMPFIPFILDSGVRSIKIIPPAKNPSDWQRVIAIWREALDRVLADKDPHTEQLAQELTQLSPLPIEFNLRRF